MSEMFQHYFTIKRFEYLLKQTLFFIVLFKTPFKWFFGLKEIKGKVKQITKKLYKLFFIHSLFHSASI